MQICVHPLLSAIFIRLTSFQYGDELIRLRGVFSPKVPSGNGLLHMGSDGATGATRRHTGRKILVRPKSLRKTRIGLLTIERKRNLLDTYKRDYLIRPVIFKY